MKISGALKTLLKKMDYHKDSPLFGVIVSRSTNPINYFRAIKIHNKRHGIPEKTTESNNRTSTPDRLPEPNVPDSNGGSTS